MNAPTPARIAAAIADLASEQAIDAWHYTTAWARLGAAKPADPIGIPLLELRHALERPRGKTQSTAVVEHWRRDGARGLLGLAGKPGRGKSHAAACWAIDRSREHCDTLWVACADWPESKQRADEREALVRRASFASALVLDDIGAGNSKAPWVPEQMEGLLMARITRTSTLLVTNKTLDELREWLGGRLWDRLAYAGGVVEIAGDRSLRERDDVVLDELGRSPRWHACSRLVDLVGCELVDGALVVGGRLDAEARRVGNGVNVYAAELLGLDRDVVRARAAELEARDRALVEAEGLDVDVSDGVTWQSLAPALTARLHANRERELAEARIRADGFERSRRELEPVAVDLSVTLTTSQLGAAKQLAAAWRVKVVELETGSWRVLRCDGAVLADGLAEGPLAYYHAALSVRQYQDGRPSPRRLEAVA